jgi:2-polyprenyl-3-methyl-5-hydroxy-6-metoxy-1,4-benzoquinol methylase
MIQDEKARQESLEWERGESYQWYEILGRFQVQSVLEVGKPPSLLDLACGDGLLTAQFCRHFSRVVGVDASSAHIKKARERCPQADFYVSMIEEIETDEKFDTVAMLCLLEHVVDPVEVLRSATIHLKPGGRVIAQVPNALAINRRIGRLMGVIENEYELSQWDIEVAAHRRYYDMQSLVTDFTKAGLNVISTGGIFYKILSTPQMEWFLKNGLWDSDEFGWGGADKLKDWRWEFCKACYKVGKEKPEDCNIIYVCGAKA